jgi:hypothetical protein
MVAAEHFPGDESARIPYTSEYLPVASLRIDRTYQRPVSWSWVNKIAQLFNRGAAEPIRVNRRPDGTISVIDGQQRTEAAKKAGVTHLWCHVYGFMTPSEEAAQFQLWNDVHRMDARDLFRAQLASGDTGALAIQKLVEECGYMLTLESHGVRVPGSIGCVKELLRIYTRPGGEARLRDILPVIRRVWPDPTTDATVPQRAKAGAASRVIVLALDNWYRTYGSRFDMRRFVESVGSDERTSDPRRLASHGVAGRDIGGMSAANVVLLLLWTVYNHGLRSNRLPHPFGDVLDKGEA